VLVQQFQIQVVGPPFAIRPARAFTAVAIPVSAAVIDRALWFVC
jgi:hypothetical protein